MVQLKVILDVKQSGASKFQFLYGTIKSYLLTLSLQLKTVFQFLYGTIKRYKSS